VPRVTVSSTRVYHGGMEPNLRINIRISNPEKEQWQAAADARGMTMTQLIKQSVRSAVAESNRLIAQGQIQWGTYPPIQNTTIGTYHSTYNTSFEG
jgi:hypothetical protein